MGTAAATVTVPLSRALAAAGAAAVAAKAAVPPAHCPPAKALRFQPQSRRAAGVWGIGATDGDNAMGKYGETVAVIQQVVGEKGND